MDIICWSFFCHCIKNSYVFVTGSCNLSFRLLLHSEVLLIKKVVLIVDWSLYCGLNIAKLLYENNIIYIHYNFEIVRMSVEMLLYVGILTPWLKSSCCWRTSLRLRRYRKSSQTVLCYVVTPHHPLPTLTHL